MDIYIHGRQVFKPIYQLIKCIDLPCVCIQCRHKYTGLPICATPCDGLDNLCADNSDELGCSFFVPFAYIIVGSVCLQIVAMAVFEVIASYLSASSRNTKTESDAQDQTGRGSFSTDKLIHDLFADLHVFGPRKAAAKAREYAAKLQLDGGSVERLNLKLFHELGSSSETMRLLDAMDNNGCFFTWKPHWVRGKKMTLFGLFLSTVSALAVYYADLAKDILIAVQFSSKMFGESVSSREIILNSLYPMTVLAVTTTAILLTEFLNLLKAAAAFGRLRERLLAFLFLPFLPGFVLHSHKSKEYLRWRHAKYDGSSSTAAAADNNYYYATSNSLRRESYEARKLYACLRSNENIGEHFVQLCLFTILLMSEDSGTRTVQTVGNIILDENRIFVYLSIGLSVFSIAKGHTNLVEATKRGHLPLLGQVIIFAYFLISTVVRASAVTVFFTPILGLFNTLTISQLAKLPFSDNVLSHILPNGTAIPLQSEWSALQQNQTVGIIPRTILVPLYVASGSLAVAFHVLAATAIWKTVLDQRDWWNILYTAVTPPIFLDWEEMYRSRTGGESIRDCWLSYRRGLLLYTLMFAIEHLLLCAPLAVLKYFLGAHAAQMEANFFPLLPEEVGSLSTVNILLFSSIAIHAVLTPFVQITLALLYFKYGHSWSRVLRQEVDIFPWE